jgi:hypothetical protein
VDTDRSPALHFFGDLGARLDPQFASRLDSGDPQLSRLLAWSSDVAAAQISLADGAAKVVARGDLQREIAISFGLGAEKEGPPRCVVRIAAGVPHGS